MEVDDKSNFSAFNEGITSLNEFSNRWIFEIYGFRLQHRVVLLFGKVMDLTFRVLLLQATDDRRRQDDVADGAEPDDEDFFHLTKGLFTFS